MGTLPAAPRTRIISGQGTLQLLTALSVLASREQAGEPRASDHLVICDVTPEFGRSIEHLARSLHQWSGVTHLPPARVGELGAQLAHVRASDGAYGPEPLAALRALLAVPRADELLLVRNWQLSNQLLIAAYPNAERIAYGDGIGYYFGPQVFLPARPQRSPVRDLLRRLGGQRLPPAPPNLPSPPFHRGFMLLPEIFGDVPPMPVTVPERHFILETIDRAAAVLPARQRLTLPVDRPVVLFLPGNYAQAGWTSRRAEVAAYVERLRPSADNGSLLLVKPHPRSTRRDLAALRAVLGRHYASVQILEPPQSHMPIEVLIHSAAGNGGQIQAVGFTTAVISLAYLYGIPCRVGFGEAVLTRYFRRNRAQMLDNERQLQAILDRLEDVRVYA